MKTEQQIQDRIAHLNRTITLQLADYGEYSKIIIAEARQAISELQWVLDQ